MSCTKENMQCVLCRSEAGIRRLVDFPQFVVCNGDACSERAELFVSVMTTQHNDDDDDDEPDPKRQKLQSETEEYTEEVYWSKLPDETWLHIIYHFRNEAETLLALTETDRRFRSLALAVAQKRFWGSPGPRADALNEHEAALVLQTARDVSEEVVQREEWALRSIKTFARIIKLVHDKRDRALNEFIRLGVTSLIHYALIAWPEEVNDRLRHILDALEMSHAANHLDGKVLLMAYVAIADASMAFNKPVKDPSSLHAMMRKLAALEIENWSQVTTQMQRKQHRATARRALTRLLLHRTPSQYRIMANNQIADLPLTRDQAIAMYITPDVNSTLRWYAASLWSDDVTTRQVLFEMQTTLRAYKIQLDSVSGVPSQQLRQDFRIKMATFAGASPWDYNGALATVIFGMEESREWTSGAVTFVKWIVEERIGDQVLLMFTALNTAYVPAATLDAVYSALETDERAEVDSKLRQLWQVKAETATESQTWHIYPMVTTDLWLLQHNLLPGRVPYDMGPITGNAMRQALDNGMVSFDNYLDIWRRGWRTPRLIMPDDWWDDLAIIGEREQLVSRFPGGELGFWTWIIENKPWSVETATTSDLEFIKRLLVAAANDQLQLVREKLVASMDAQTIQNLYGWPLLNASVADKNVQWPPLILRYFF